MTDKQRFYFVQFLFGYVAKGRSISDESLEAFNKYQVGFIDNYEDYKYYTYDSIEKFCEYLKEHLSESEIGNLYITPNKVRYECTVIALLRGIIDSLEKLV